MLDASKHTQHSVPGIAGGETLPLPKATVAQHNVAYGGPAMPSD